MGRAFLASFIGLLFFFSPLCISQSTVKISDPRLEVKNNTLQISYDILDEDPEEKYIISINIRDEDGNILKANTLKGDIGIVEDGGRNKRIIWDPSADNVFINSNIYVKVNLEIILPQKPEITPVEEKPAEHVAPEIKGPAEFSRAGLVMQSLAFPGLGLSRYSGNPHWLRGVAGYGCIGGSIVLNKMSWKNYDGISDLTEYVDKDDLYQKALKQYNSSRILAYTAIGIWVSDFIWTLVGTSDLKRQSSAVHPRGLFIGSDIDPVTCTPLLCLNYRF